MTPETPADITSDENRSGYCARKEDFGSGENRTVCAEEGLRFGREPNCERGRRTSVWPRTELCARKKDFGSGENRPVCAEDGYSLDVNNCV